MWFRTNRLTLLLAFVLSVHSGYVQAYSYFFKSLKVDDGLSYHTVYSSLQDKKGFLWFGTRDGLNRYDGYKFKVFRHDPHNPRSIGSNFIVNLFQDRTGVLWIGTTNGLYFYNEDNESFHLVEGTVKNRVTSMKMDKKQTLWFISDSTICRYREGRVYRYSKEQLLEPTSIAMQANGDMWVATNKGVLAKYNEKADAFIRFPLFDGTNINFRRVEVIYDTGRESLLVGTSHLGIKTFDTRTYRLSNVIERNADNTRIFVRAFVQSKPDEFWCGTESGLFIYNIATGQIVNVRKRDNDPYSISDNSIYTLTRDKEGGIWLGTYFAGLNYFPYPYNSFDKYYSASRRNSLRGNIIRDICQDKNGMIWIGTEDAGLNKFDPDTELFTHYYPTGSPSSLSYTNIHGLLAHDDEMWVGTFEHGLDILDIHTGKVIRHYDAGNKPGNFKSDFITTLYKTKGGTILVGTSHGAYSYNSRSDNFSIIPEIPPGAFIYVIYEDHRGTVWVGTIGNGVYYYNPYTKEKGHKVSNPDDPNSLGSNTVYGIFEDSKHNLWFCIENKGLWVLKEDREAVINYTTANGLPSNHTFKVLEDSSGSIWVSTFEGLVCLNVNSGAVRNYTTGDGLLSNQFNYGSGFRDRQGNIFFGSVSGLIRFHPERFVKKSYAAPVYITGFQVYNKELDIDADNTSLQKTIINADEVTLRHNQASFSIDFAALAFTSPENTSYSYILEGLEKNWTFLKTNRKVYFTELPPGEYTFKVRSHLSDRSSKSSASLRIIIQPPWWASKVAYGLYGLAASVVVYLSIRLYHQRVKDVHKRRMELLESKVEKDVYEAKINFFTSVAHEIRTPLTLIKGPLEMIAASDNLQEIKENIDTMERNTSRLLTLTNQLLDFRRIETKDYSLSFVRTNINSLLNDNIFRFKTIVDQRGLKLSVRMPDKELYAYVDPEALTKIFSNLINNSVKYADSEIAVSLTADDDFSFKLEIRNDGKLITDKYAQKIFEPFFRMQSSVDVQGTGIGLPLARSLANLHKGTLSLEPSETCNVFLLELPVNQELGFKFNNSVAQNEEEDGLENDRPGVELKPSLLLVEDNKEIIRFIMTALGRDYTYITAFNGMEALKKLENNQVHLIISDVMMPVMDGFELCKRVKTDFSYSHVPIILLTAKDTLQSKIEGLESGADAYIEKPFSPEYLKVQTANLLANRLIIKEYFARTPTATMKSMAHSKADEAFLDRLNGCIQKHIFDSSFAIEHLAEEMNMSRPTLFRKIKAISNLTPNELINIARIKKAAELMSENDYKVYEVSDMVGFSSPTVFSRVFQRQFGYSPTEFMNSRIKRE